MVMFLQVIFKMIKLKSNMYNVDLNFLDGHLSNNKVKEKEKEIYQMIKLILY